MEEAQAGTSRDILDPARPSHALAYGPCAPTRARRGRISRPASNNKSERFIHQPADQMLRSFLTAFSRAASFLATSACFFGSSLW